MTGFQEHRNAGATRAWLRRRLPFLVAPLAAPLVAPLAALALLAPAPAAAQAQAPTPPSRDELVPPPARPEQRRGPSLTIDGQMERTPCALDNPDFADIRVTLSEVSITGAGAAGDVDLAQASAPYLGRELPISVLCDIRSEVSRLLAEAGYLAAVEIPEQRLTEGHAELRVVLGRLTALRVRGDAGPSERLLTSYLQGLVGQEVFNTKEAERTLLLAGDIPGLDVRLALRAAAGGQPGELIGEVAVLHRSLAVDLNIQNYGSRAIGRFGGLLRAELFSLTGMGDRTTLAWFASRDFDEQQTVQLGHDMMVGSGGLTLGGQVTLGWTHPTIDIANFDVKSDTVFASLRASYPFRRTQQSSIHGGFGIDFVDQDVKANGTLLSRDHVRTAWMRLSATATDRDSIARRGGFNAFEPQALVSGMIELRQGLDVFGTNIDCRTRLRSCVADNVFPSRMEQDPTPLLLRAELHNEYRPVPRLAFVMDVEGQYTRDPLPAFEEMTGGNYSIGRGYDPGSISGDSGLAVTLETRFGSILPRSPDALALQPYAFVEAAALRDRDPSERLRNPDRLGSAGAGLRFTHGRGMQGDMALAVPLVRTDSQRLNGEPRGDVRFLLSVTARLLPWRF